MPDDVGRKGPAPECVIGCVVVSDTRKGTPPQSPGEPCGGRCAIWTGLPTSDGMRAVCGDISGGVSFVITFCIDSRCVFLSPHLSPHLSPYAVTAVTTVVTTFVTTVVTTRLCLLLSVSVIRLRQRLRQTACVGDAGIVPCHRT